MAKMFHHTRQNGLAGIDASLPNERKFKKTIESWKEKNESNQTFIGST
jgi:hypothetical protein